MSLRRAVTLAVISASLLILGLLIHLARSSAIGQALDETSRLSNIMTAEFAELDQLAYEYMLHPHERPAQQWRILSDRLGKQFIRLEELGDLGKRVTQLRSELLQARELFDTIIADTERINQKTSATIQLQRSRLAEQLLLLSRSLMNHANLIHRDSLREQSRIKFRDDAITIIALGATIALLVWLLMHVHRQVLSRIELLKQSAERAAAGDLFVRTQDDRDDEIGRLARTFDNMLVEVRTSREHLRQEEALRASEERQRQLIDALPGLVWAAQPDGTIDISNASWRRNFAVTPETPGYNWAELIYSPDRSAWESAWSAALRSQEGFEIEFRLHTEAGWRWYLTRVAPLKTATGTLLRWVCKAVDIHHHKELEIHLRNSRNQAELLNQVGLDLVGELNIDRLTQRVTDAARALVDAEFAALFYNAPASSGEDKDRLYAVSGLPKEVFQDFGLPRVTALFKPTFTGDGPVRCDDVRCDPRYGLSAPHNGIPPGHPAVVSYLAVPVRTRSGDVIGGLFCGHSHVGQFTAQHERLLSGIAALAATAFDSARLIEAERRQRRLADKRASELVRSNAELEQFAYICSHDLQEPLRMVRSFLGLIEDRYQDVLDERGRGFIHRAVEGAERMQHLVRDVLQYSRVGRGERAEEVVSINNILDEVQANLKTAIDSAGARIDYGVLPRVRVNRLQCVQLFQNLISNALKFVSDKPPVIRITAEEQGRQWRISVSDNGIGIDPSFHQRIFQVFQRLHDRERFDGTGIGLSLCQKIVQAHGGTIGVISQSGQGATFWFTLPGEMMVDHTPSSGVQVLPKDTGQKEVAT